MAYTVGEVAKLAHVSVRTLHHYDAIGLLRPSHRTSSGYRQYTMRDLELLQQILFYRELGFSLEEIGVLIKSPLYDRKAAFAEQRDLLVQRVARYQQMIALIDKSLAAMEGGVRMSPKDMFDVFGDFDPTQYADEVEERWGHTEAYRESARRTATYTKEDWQRFKQENEAATNAIVKLMDEGLPADDPRVLDAVEQSRLLIDKWFYPCSREMHAQLGKMYVADERFKATYENIRPGLAQYLCDATAANAARE